MSESFLGKILTMREIIEDMTVEERESARQEAHEWVKWHHKAKICLDQEFRTAQHNAVVLRGLRCRPTVSEFLDGLLIEANQRGLGPIRFYHYQVVHRASRRLLPSEPATVSGHISSDELKLVSVDSSGHDSEDATALRVGFILNLGSAAPSDSFCCFKEGRPTVFRVDAKCNSPLVRSEEQGGLPLYRLPCDPCAALVKKGRVWIDFPLIIAGKRIGKLSCDSSQKRVDSRLAAQVQAFWELVQLAAPYLEALYQKEMEQPVSAAIAVIDKCETLEDLYRACTEDLPQILGCRYGSILTITEDSMHTKKLVLRRTSFPGSKHREDRGFYFLTEDGLTPWIARTGKSVCLQHLSNEIAKPDKLRMYGADIKWVNKIPDHDPGSCGDFLGVAIPAGPEEGSPAIGVLRYTQKERDGEHFTERHQRQVEILASNHIGPRLPLLLEVEASKSIRTARVDVMSVRETIDPARPEGVLKEMQRLFPETERVRRLYLVNLLEPDQVHFRHWASGGKLLGKTEALYPTEGTFTGEALKQLDGRCVFLNDVELGQSCNVIRSIAPEGVCALACRIAFSGEPYGGLGLMSDRYDLLPEVHGPLLEQLAKDIGIILAIRDLRQFFPNDCGLSGPGPAPDLPKGLKELKRKQVLYGEHKESDYVPYRAVMDLVCDFHPYDRIHRANRVGWLAAGPNPFRAECAFKPDVEVEACARILSSVVFNLVKQECSEMEEVGAEKSGLHAMLEPCRLVIRVQNSRVARRIHREQLSIGGEQSIFSEQCKLSLPGLYHAHDMVKHCTMASGRGELKVEGSDIVVFIPASPDQGL